MKYYLLRTVIISFLFSVFSYGYADDSSCGIPAGPNDDALPVPTDNVPYFKALDALCGGDSEYTWDYSGAVKDNDQTFSFQASIIQLVRNDKSNLGLHIFDFGFKDNNGDYLFSNSTYGGEDQKNNAVSQSTDHVNASATLQQFSVSATSISDPRQKWIINSVTRIPQAPLYKGWVGQPGQEYQLTGVGKTFLWRYDATTGAATVAPYTYSFSVTVLDERGLATEGLGGGYVGPQLVPQPDQNKSGYNVENEIAQPRLKVLSWAVSFTAQGAVKKGYAPNYNFSGNNGMLFNDVGPVTYVNKTSYEKINTLIQSTPPVSEKTNVIENDNPAGLYNGNWIPVEFTRGKYAGATLVFSVFWDKAEKYPTDQSTDNFSWSDFGWSNFFSGIIPNEVDSTFSTLETLYPENPVLPNPGTSEIPSYSVALNQFVPSKYSLSFPWVQTLTITIKANTALRYAMAIYADKLAKSNTADDPSQDIVMTVNAISPITQNTLFSNTITQYYEGAATPMIDGQNVGYAWIEHMI